jgi:hypothetical protein
MTLAEAIGWISKRDDCSRRAAKDQIRAALADNAIGHSHLRWEDAAGDYPPIYCQFWQKASIRRGQVFDPETRRWRKLLILKQSIFQIWPAPSATSAGSESGKPGPTRKAKGRGRPIACPDVHKAADRLSQQGRKLKDMPQKEREALVVEASRRCLRTVQKYLPSWLENHRADA